MQAVLIKKRKQLLDISYKYDLKIIKDQLENRYDLYDPEIGSLKPYYYALKNNNGFIGIICIDSNNVKYKDYLHILSYDIASDWKGQNGAALMINWVSEKAKSMGWKGISVQTINPVNKVWLNDDENNKVPEDLQIEDEKSKGDRLVQDYKKLGFEPVSYTKWGGINLKKTFESHNLHYDIFKSLFESL